jgi:hypothetical protein
MPVLLTLIGGLVTLLAVTYGKRLERDHWLRDRRLAAYADLLGSVGDAQMVRHNESAKDLTWRPYLIATSMVVLLGPPEVAKAARALRTTVVAGWKREPGNEVDVVGLAAARRRFVQAAQKALGV